MISGIFPKRLEDLSKMASDNYERYAELLKEAKEPIDIERLAEDFKKETDKYLEQPELVDEKLKKLLDELTSQIANPQSDLHYHGAFKIIYQIIKLSGMKNIGRRLPHDIDKLPLIIELLSKEDPRIKNNWETRYSLTIWLAILVLVPFDLDQFDPTMNMRISERIYQMLTNSLTYYDSCQQVTTFCLAKFFSRPDVIESREFIDRFMVLSLEVIDKAKLEIPGTEGDIALIGYLRTFGHMYKYVPRVAMKRLSLDILNSLSKLDLDRMDRILVSYLSVKVMVRAALSLLPTREPEWRYKRAKKIIGRTKGSSTPSKDASQVQSEDEEEPAQVFELILNILLYGAQNLQTKIRWSAAKGIARIAGRLSEDRACEIVELVLDTFFKPDSSEYAWHGGTLALAEMCRYGFILEKYFPRVTDIVKDSIVFDRLRGSAATGSHVREAACYICWSMSRTYEQDIIKPYVPAIITNLLCAMLFDRELHCRRAASAAFQEVIGRQGTYNEKDLNILTDLDYFSLGQRPQTYMTLALKVVDMDKSYAEVFVRHLIEKKVGHWDIEVRRLVGDTLSALMLHSEMDFVDNYVVPTLIEMSNQDEDNTLKHGAILALAKVIRGLITLEYKFKPEHVEFVGSISGKCEKYFKVRQLASMYMDAISQLVISAEKASFKYDEDSDTLKQWHSIVLSALDTDEEQVRESGALAFLSLYSFYFVNNKSIQDNLLTTLNNNLKHPNESTRCGALQSLAKLTQVPSQLIGESKSIKRDSDIVNILLISISSYVSKETYEKDLDKVFAGSKATACEALVEAIRNLDDISLIASTNLIQAAFDALLTKIQDYTFDRRGDIGVIVRRGSIRSLRDLTLYLLARGKYSLFHEERTRTLIARLLQQAVSYHDSTRDDAGKAFYELINSDLPSENIPHKERIIELLNKFQVNETFDWRNESIPIFVNLLSKTEYNHDLWVGLISGVGQASSIGSKPFRVALADYIRYIDRPEADDEREQVFLSFLSTIEAVKTIDRTLLTSMTMIDFLLTEGLMDHNICGERLIKFCWDRRGTNDPKRLVCVSRAVATMLSFPSKIQLEALKRALALLANGYSKIRTFTADQLYSNIVANQSELEETLNLSHNTLGDSKAYELVKMKSDNKKANINEALNVLISTNWGEPLEKVRPIRDEICQLLTIDPSTVKNLAQSPTK